MKHLSNNKNQPVKYSLATPEVEDYSPEWFLLNYLDPWTVADMELAIKKNFDWDLGSHQGTIIDYVTDQILNYMKTHRPDLHTVLSKPEGKKWLRKNLVKLMTQK